MNRGLVLAALLAAGIAGGVGLSARLDRPAEDKAPNLEAALAVQAVYNRAASIAQKAVVHITINDDLGSDNVGSGVIVSGSGHIVTNYHVIRQNQGGTCVARFVDGATYAATIEGHDEDSDLAVLKIDPAGRPLFPIVFGDSDKVRVGDIVFAVGSPFGYTHTVTSGIVSAKHRRVEMEKPYEDYVQTDAAINPGNSGGALVNLRGELVGLNSAMVSGSRTNDGVGLAIASNLVKWVQERLIRDGEVRRGYLGINIVDLDYKALEGTKLFTLPRLQGVSSQGDLEKTLGAPEGGLVVGIRPGGPAEAIGLQVLDVLTEIDGRPIRNVHELILRVVELEPGKTIKLKFVREGKVQTAQATLQERPRRQELHPPVPPPSRNQ
jgi:serine protease Do